MKLSEAAPVLEELLAALPFDLDVNITSMVYIPEMVDIIEGDEGERCVAPPLPTGWARRKEEILALLGIRREAPPFCCCGRPTSACRAIARHDKGGPSGSPPTQRTNTPSSPMGHCVRGGASGGRRILQT